MFLVGDKRSAVSLHRKEGNDLKKVPHNWNPKSPFRVSLGDFSWWSSWLQIDVKDLIFVRFTLPSRETKFRKVHWILFERVTTSRCTYIVENWLKWTPTTNFTFDPYVWVKLFVPVATWNVLQLEQTCAVIIHYLYDKNVNKPSCWPYHLMQTIVTAMFFSKLLKRTLQRGMQLIS